MPKDAPIMIYSESETRTMFLTDLIDIAKTEAIILARKILSQLDTNKNGSFEQREKC